MSETIGETRVASAREIAGNLLLVGAIAAIVAGVLGAMASAIDSLGGEGVRWTIAALNIVAMIAGYVVIAAFVRMTRVFDPVALRSLRRSAICMFAMTMILVAATSISELGLDSGPKAALTSLLLVGVGFVLLFFYAVGGSNWWMLLATYLSMRYLFGWLFTGKSLDPLTAMAATAFLLALGSMIGYSIWFALCLLNTRLRFGASSEALALTVLAGLACAVIFCIYITGSMAMEPELERMNDQEMDAWLTPKLKLFNWINLGLELLGGLFMATLLLGARRRLRLPASDPSEAAKA